MEIREKLLLIGPNRHSEQTIFEQQFVLVPAELEALAARLPAICAGLAKAPLFSDGHYAALIQPSVEGGKQPLAAFAQIFSGLALAVQQSAGHRVNQRGFTPDSVGHGVWVWFEYEHDEVAARASGLALQWLAELEPALGTPADSDGRNVDCATRYGEFLGFARDLVLPGDTEAIFAAAARLDVPCMKLEREPYEAPTGQFRVRMNGMLKLGHGAYQNVIDGTFCRTRNEGLIPLLRDRVALRQELVRLQAPSPACDPAAGNCQVSRKAIRAAEHLGFPVVVKAGVRGSRAGVFLNVRTADEVRAAVDGARRLSGHVSVESWVAGQSCKVLVVNHAVLGAFAAGQEIHIAGVHRSIVDLACRMSRSWGVGMLLLDVVTTDVGRPLEETGGAVVDCDLAPQLDCLVPVESGLPGRAAEAFVRWMYPPGATARIPVIAVTGTNGKTTTCRMIARIMRTAGRHTGMVCSDGTYFDEEFTAPRNNMGPGAHHRVLEVAEVDIAVLEEYFGRVLRLGFAFNGCEVSVCTNVTNDHLGRIGIHTLREMAEVKFEVVRRAREAVVLNANDPLCLAMAERASARRTCLVSTLDTAEAQTRALENANSRCVVEDQSGRPFIVIYDGQERIPIIAIDDIPATFNGTAAHNISNAMHAAAACHFAGASTRAIAEGLRSFIMSFDATPGRLNVFDGLPFRVIMDYAHNADGFRRICAFVDQQEVSGRKILMVGFSGDRQDSDIKSAGTVLAGHFDHYVCRNFRGLRDRLPHEIPALLMASLRSAGIAESAITIVPEAELAVRTSLGLARPGDVVVLLVGSTEFQAVWDLLHSMAGSGRA